MTVLLPVGFIIFFLSVTYCDIKRENQNLLIILQNSFSCIKPEYYKLINDATLEIDLCAKKNLALLIVSIIIKCCVYFIVLDIQTFVKVVLPRLGGNVANFIQAQEDILD